MENINDKVFETLYASNLCWTVGKEQLYTEDGTVATGGYATRRSDDGSILGVVGSSYKPFQNHELVKEFIEATREFGLQNIEGVAVNGGKKVVLKARLGDIKIGNDLVHRYITGSNTHDGSGPIKLGMYNKVQVCSNGLHREFNHKQLATVKHTTNSTEKMQWYLKNIPLILKAEEEMMANYQKWTEIKVEEKHIKEVIKRIYQVDPKADPKDVSGKKKAQVERFMNAVNNNGLNVHGNTIWGLFGAQTYIGSRNMKGELNNDRVMAGSSMEKSNLTYDLLLSMMNESYKFEEELEFIEA